MRLISRRNDTFMDNASRVIYNILEWITKFAYLHILWIFFTIAGGVLFGFFPSTTAMFAIIRDWLRGNTDTPLFKTYWEFFKRDFLKSNGLGIFITAIASIIGIDLYYIQNHINDVLTWTYIPLFAFILLFTIFIFYVFPAFVHYDLPVFKVMKNAFLIMLINPLNSFLILLCLGLLFMVMRTLPALAFIFGGSTYAFITMWLCLHAFNKVQGKQNK